MMYCLEARELKPFDSIEFDGATYTALPATHAPGTYGYLIETPLTKLFYASDSGRLPSETAERVKGVDVLILDATFWKRNWSPDAHHSVQETIEEGLELEAASAPRATRDAPWTARRLQANETPAPGAKPPAPGADFAGKCPSCEPISRSQILLFY